MDLVENLLPSPTVKEFKKSVNICQSFEMNIEWHIFYGSQCICVSRESSVLFERYCSCCI